MRNTSASVQEAQCTTCFMRGASSSCPAASASSALHPKATHVRSSQAHLIKEPSQEGLHGAERGPWRGQVLVHRRAAVHEEPARGGALQDQSAALWAIIAFAVSYSWRPVCGAANCGGGAGSACSNREDARKVLCDKSLINCKHAVRRRLQAKCTRVATLAKCAAFLCLAMRNLIAT